MNIRCPNCQTVFRVDPARVPAGGVRARCARCSATFAVKREGVAPAAEPAAAPQSGETPSAGAPFAARQSEGVQSAGAESPGRESVGAQSAAAQTGAAQSAAAPPGAGQQAPSGREQAEPAEAGGAKPAPHRDAYAATAPGPSPAVTGPSPAAPGGVAAAGQPSRPAAASATAARPSAAGPGSSGAGAAQAIRRPVFGSKDPDSRAQRIARALVSDIVAYHPKRRDESLSAGTLRSDFREEIMKSWEEYVAQVGLDLAKATPHFRNALNDILAKGQAVF